MAVAHLASRKSRHIEVAQVTQSPQCDASLPLIACRWHNNITMQTRDTYENRKTGKKKKKDLEFFFTHKLLVYFTIVLNVKF